MQYFYINLLLVYVKYNLRYQTIKNRFQDYFPESGFGGEERIRTTKAKQLIVSKILTIS